MRGQLLKFLILLSMLISIGVACLWIESRFRLHTWMHVSSDLATPQRAHVEQRIVTSEPGGIVIAQYLITFVTDHPNSHDQFDVEAFNEFDHERLVRGWDWTGIIEPLKFHWGYHRSAPQRYRPGFRSDIYLYIPYWVLLLLFVFTPAIHFRNWLRQQRARRLLRAGLCGHCGYDMRASPDRCPECGTVMEPGIAAPSSAAL